MFEARGISSGYHGVTVVKGINLEVNHEIFAVLGANGAGKTTTLATMARLIPLMGGELWFDGEDVTHIPPWETAARGLGYVPQEHGVFPQLTVMENLGLYADLRGVTGGERADAFERLLRFTDLARFTKRLASALSGGMKQKLGLACALIRRTLGRLPCRRSR